MHNILLKENYIFSCMLTDEILNNICVIAVKRAPTNLLTFKSRGQHNSRNRGSVIHGPIDHIFSYEQNAIPNLLKAISDSGRNNLFIPESHIIMVMRYKENLEQKAHTGVFDHAGNFVESGDVEDYREAEKAIAKYCTKIDDGDYDVEPYYLLPIKGSVNFKEFKQPFKGIYGAIKSNDFSKVESSLKQVKENIDKYSNNISEILTTLIREAKSNKSIAHLISNFQEDVTHPKSCLESAKPSLSEAVEKER